MEEKFAYLILSRGFPNRALSGREALKHQKEHLLWLLDCTSSELKEAEDRRFGKLYFNM